MTITKKKLRKVKRLCHSQNKNCFQSQLLKKIFKTSSVPFALQATGQTYPMQTRGIILKQLFYEGALDMK